LGDGSTAIARPHEVESANLNGYAATYRLNRYSRHTLGRLGILTGNIPEQRVAQTNAGLFLLGARLQPLGNDTFRRGDTGSVVAFRRGPNGRATHLFFENAPYAAYERVPWYDGRMLHAAAFAVCLVLFISGFVAGV